MKKSEKYGLIGTAISSILILLLLIFVVLPGLETVEDDGVMISFGEVYDGSGASQTPSSTIAQPSSPQAEVKEDLLTQEDQSVAMNETRRADELAQQRLEEQLKQEQQASQKAEELIGSSFGSSTGTGSGSTTDDQVAGNPVGSGTSGGHSWSLSGRNLLGTMPTPYYNQNVEGFLTVEIRVDASGKVLSATVDKGTISDRSLREEARKAALRTQFSSGKGTVSGTITYKFKLK